MKQEWVVILGISLMGATIGDLQKHESNEKSPGSKLTTLSMNPTLEPWATSVKQKRCSNNNVKRSNVKTYEERRLEALCNFCKKSKLRMKTLLCRKCVENPFFITPSNTPYYLRSTLENVIGQSNERNNTLEGVESNVENFETSDESDQLDSANSLETIGTTKGAENYGGDSQMEHPPEFENLYPLTNHILGRFSPKFIPSIRRENGDSIDLDFFKKSTNNMDPTPTLREKSGTKTLNHLTHKHYLNILKEAIQTSEDNFRSTDIQKRNLGNFKKAKRKLSEEEHAKRARLLGYLPHQIVFLSSEEESSELTGSPVSSNATEETKAMSKSTTLGTIATKDLTATVTDKPPRFHAQFNHNKRPRKKIVNNEWVVETEPPKNILPKINSILKMIEPEKENNSITSTATTSEDSLKLNLGSSIFNNNESNKIHSKEDIDATKLDKNTSQEDFTNKPGLQRTLDNSVIASERPNTSSTIPDPINKTESGHIVTKKPTLKEILLNRQINKKNQRLKSTHLNGKHKEVLENITTENLSISSSTTEKTISTLSSERADSVLLETKLNFDINPTELIDPTKSTESEVKKVSTRSTKVLPTSEQNSNTDHEVVKKILPTRHSLFHLLTKSDDGKHDIFHKNLNMTPKISSDKYKNIALSTKNNIIRTRSTKNPPKVNSVDVDPILEQTNDKSLQTKIGFRLLENKIHLPLILRQNADGTVQLILDKSEICSNCSLSSVTEKNVFKRKTVDLTKHPMNVFNIIENNSDRSTNINNLQATQGQNTNNELKDRFYEYLIDAQLFKLFKTLNIPVETPEELRSYIEDLENDEKLKLNQYLLNNISRDFSTNDDNFNEELFYEAQNEFIKGMMNQQSLQKTKKSNKISMNIAPKYNFQPNDLDYGSNLIKSLIQDEIQKRLKYVCPTCPKDRCTCLNDDIKYHSIENNANNEKIIDKRHYTQAPKKKVFNEGDIGQQKYKIAASFVNWAHDIIKNDTH